MDSHLYLKNLKKTIPMQDYLSASRTILANERTFLSYFRTALTMLVVGVTFIKILEQFFFQILGWMLILISFVVFIYGLRRYHHMTDLIIRLEKEEAKGVMEKLKSKMQK